MIEVLHFNKGEKAENVNLWQLFNDLDLWKYKLVVGDVIDVLDSNLQWREATVKIVDRYVRVHFAGDALNSLEKLCKSDFKARVRPLHKLFNSFYFREE